MVSAEGFTTVPPSVVRDRHHGNAQPLADARLAQRLVGERAGAERDVGELGQAVAGGHVRGIGAQDHGAVEAVEVGEHAVLRQRQSSQRVTDQGSGSLHLGLDDLGGAGAEQRPRARRGRGSARGRARPG